MGALVLVLNPSHGGMGLDSSCRHRVTLIARESRAKLANGEAWREISDPWARSVGSPFTFVE